MKKSFKPAEQRTTKQVVAGICLRNGDGHILICQRHADQPLGLKWEFPGGKIEPGEEPRDALKRELQEELGITADIGDEVARLVHTYRNGNAVELTFFRVHGFTGELENRIFADMQWAPRTSLPEYDFLEADVKLVQQIADGLIV